MSSWQFQTGAAEGFTLEYHEDQEYYYDQSNESVLHPNQTSHNTLKNNPTQGSSTRPYSSASFDSFRRDTGMSSSEYPEPQSYPTEEYAAPHSTTQIPHQETSNTARTGSSSVISKYYDFIQTQKNLLQDQSKSGIPSLMSKPLASDDLHHGDSYTNDSNKLLKDHGRMSLLSQQGQPSQLGQQSHLTQQCQLRQQSQFNQQSQLGQQSEFDHQSQTDHQSQWSQQWKESSNNSMPENNIQEETGLHVQLKDKTESLLQSAFCDICNISFSTPQHYNMHCQGMVHQQRADETKLLERAHEYAGKQADTLENHQATFANESLGVHPSSRSNPVTDHACTHGKHYDQPSKSKPQVQPSQHHMSPSDVKSSYTSSQSNRTEPLPRHSSSSKINQSQQVAAESPLDQGNKSGSLPTSAHKCTLCDLSCTSPESYNQHCKSYRHCKKFLFRTTQLGLKGFTDKYPKALFTLEDKHSPVPGCKDPSLLFIHRSGVLNKYECRLCLKKCFSSTNWTSHCMSRSHSMRVTVQMAKLGTGKFVELYGDLPGVNEKALTEDPHDADNGDRESVLGKRQAQSHSESKDGEPQSKRWLSGTNYDQSAASKLLAASAPSLMTLSAPIIPAIQSNNGGSGDYINKNSKPTELILNGSSLPNWITMNPRHVEAQLKSGSLSTSQLTLPSSESYALSGVPKQNHEPLRYTDVSDLVDWMTMNPHDLEAKLKTGALSLSQVKLLLLMFETHGEKAAKLDSALLDWMTLDPCNFESQLQSGDLALSQIKQLLLKTDINLRVSNKQGGKLSHAQERMELPNWLTLDPREVQDNVQRGCLLSSELCFWTADKSTAPCCYTDAKESDMENAKPFFHDDDRQAGERGSMFTSASHTQSLPISRSLSPSSTSDLGLRHTPLQGRDTLADHDLRDMESLVGQDEDHRRSHYKKEKMRLQPDREEERMLQSKEMGRKDRVVRNIQGASDWESSVVNDMDLRVAGVRASIDAEFGDREREHTWRRPFVPDHDGRDEDKRIGDLDMRARELPFGGRDNDLREEPLALDMILGDPSQDAGLYEEDEYGDVDVRESELPPEFEESRMGPQNLTVAEALHSFTRALHSFIRVLIDDRHGGHGRRRGNYSNVEDCIASLSRKEQEMFDQIVQSTGMEDSFRIVRAIENLRSINPQVLQVLSHLSPEDIMNELGDDNVVNSGAVAELLKHLLYIMCQMGVEDSGAVQESYEAYTEEVGVLIAEEEVPYKDEGRSERQEAEGPCVDPLIHEEAHWEDPHVEVEPYHPSDDIYIEGDYHDPHEYPPRRELRRQSSHRRDWEDRFPVEEAAHVYPAEEEYWQQDDGHYSEAPTEYYEEQYHSRY